MIDGKNNITYYFGDKKDNLLSSGNYQPAAFDALANKLGIEKLFFLKQTHSKDVYLLNSIEKNITLFEITGDAIITQEKNIGIGVVTADCLPLFIIDNQKNAIAAIHAGWKGLSLKLISETIEKMKKAFDCHVSDLKVYIGPSAGGCCYEVQADFLPHFEKTIFDDEIAEKRGEKIFFHPKKAALLELERKGVLAENIDTALHSCTICDERFCSVRREKEKAGRQPSVIVNKVKGCSYV